MSNTLPNGATIITIDYRKGVVLASEKRWKRTSPVSRMGKYIDHFMTWQFPVWDGKPDLGGTWGGHYFNTDEVLARRDFAERCAGVRS